MRELVEAVDRATELRLEEFVAPVVWRQRRNLFEMLVAVVLSQNTSDRNAFRALEGLRRRLGEITSQAILSLPEEELQQLIRPAGMHRMRAARLRELAREFASRGVTAEALLRAGPGEARRILASLPGVGPKTADVVLANLGMPAFPVDTHIFRIARRWGLGRRYEEVSGWFMANFPPDRLLELHLKLIQFGRHICRARSPRCCQCPVGPRCPSYRCSAGRSPVTGPGPA